MYRDSWIAKTGASLLIVLLTAFVVAFTWAVIDDYVRRDIMPMRASIDAVPVGGLSHAAATGVVRERVEAVLLSPATVRFRDRSFTLDTPAYASVDVEGMVDEALSPKTNAMLPFRVLDRLKVTPIGIGVERRMRIDEKRLAAWVAEVDRQVATPAVDATYSVEATGLRFAPEVDGHQVDTTAAVPALAKTLVAGTKEFDLPDRPTKAQLTLANFGKSILVKTSQRRLWLYNGEYLEKTYPIAVGTPGHPTPHGVWRIVNKRKWPSWSNPAPNGWGAGMPAYIAPGVGNPLGTRALDLDAPGIRFHGTTKIGSIGTAASHGCMRMLRRDVEEMFEIVPIGTRVIIVR